VDFAHWILVGILALLIAMTIGGFVAMARTLRKDEAIAK
jgi:uncharacterized protein YneF (UPF0154 family)